MSTELKTAGLKTAGLLDIETLDRSEIERAARAVRCAAGRRGSDAQEEVRHVPEVSLRDRAAARRNGARLESGRLASRSPVNASIVSPTGWTWGQASERRAMIWAAVTVRRPTATPMSGSLGRRLQEVVWNLSGAPLATLCM